MKNINNQDRHNLILNCAHEFFWGIGLSFHTVYAIIPLFLKQLGAPQGICLSVAGLWSILVAFPQLFTAIIGRNIKNIKRTVIGVHIFAMPPIFFAGFIFAFFAPSGPYSWVLYYICFILYGIGIGIIIPIWTEFLNHTFSINKRGKYLGISFAWNSIGGFFGGFAVRLVLNSNIPFPQNFGWGFLIFFTCILIGTILFKWYHIKLDRNNHKNRSINDFLSETKSIIKTDFNFRNYLISRMFLTANYPAISLYAVYTQNKFDFDISEAGVFVIINVIASGAGSLLSGWIGDLYGHKNSILLSFISYLMALLVALLANNMFHVYIIFLFLGLGLGAFMPSAMNLIYKFADGGDNKIYMALTDTILAPFTFLAITIVGSISKFITMEIILMGIGVFLLIGIFIMIFFVDDPSNMHKKQIISYNVR
ncbi:MAG: MFS transporter [Candidatus Neomarinimicrobiota bacterium]|nr:MFS transporter [Candidatus Neomarinimicrobiota bacterium]MEE3196038.1 MFS transporter [Candidatus Neomarinimicrobiota bacterium]